MKETVTTYKLEDKRVVPCSEEEWLKQMRDTKSRIVGKDCYFHVTVSTVFIGYDPDISAEENVQRYRKIQWEDNAPWAFESCVFGWPTRHWWKYEERYRSWEDAKQGHEKMLEEIRREINGIYWKVTGLVAMTLLVIKFLSLVI